MQQKKRAYIRLNNPSFCRASRAPVPVCPVKATAMPLTTAGGMTLPSPRPRRACPVRRGAAEAALPSPFPFLLSQHKYTPTNYHGHRACPCRRRLRTRRGRHTRASPPRWPVMARCRPPPRGRRRWPQAAATRTTPSTRPFWQATVRLTCRLKQGIPISTQHPCPLLLQPRACSSWEASDAQRRRSVLMQGAAHACVQFATLPRRRWTLDAAEYAGRQRIANAIRKEKR